MQVVFHCAECCSRCSSNYSIASLGPSSLEGPHSQVSFSSIYFNFLKLVFGLVNIWSFWQFSCHQAWQTARADIQEQPTLAPGPQQIPQSIPSLMWGPPLCACSHILAPMRFSLTSITPSKVPWVHTHKSYATYMCLENLGFRVLG